MATAYEISPLRTSDRMRSAPRAAMDIEVRVHGAALGDWVPLRTRDVSMAGIFVVADVLFDEGTELWCVLALAGDTVRGRGRVVRVDEGASPGFAVEWTELSEPERRRLRLALARA